MNVRMSVCVGRGIVGKLGYVRGMLGRCAAMVNQRGKGMSWTSQRDGLVMYGYHFLVCAIWTDAYMINPTHVGRDVVYFQEKRREKQKWTPNPGR